MFLQKIQLLLLGFFTLFLELALIRYLPTKIWNLGYFPNFVLLSAFLGIGLGFLFHKKFPDRRSDFFFLVALVLVLGLILNAIFLKPMVPGFSGQYGDFGGDFYFTWIDRESDAFMITSFVFVFVLTVAIFTLISQKTAKLFQLFSPLHAYSLDIAGSCLGITFFILISWLQLPAWIWFLLLVPVAGVILNSTRHGLWNQTVGGACILLIVALLAGQDHVLDTNSRKDSEVYWSPYQRLELKKSGRYERTVFANDILHQVMHTRAELESSFYTNIYKKLPGQQKIDNVLVIGAGTGNDVAAALINEAEHVDAVEIDPVLLKIGAEFSPLQAFESEKVRKINTDGRLYLRQSDKKYDLIIFALTDSLVKVSALAQLRLENYLFTMTSLRQAYELLAPGGSIVLYNNYRHAWLQSRIYYLAASGTGRLPEKVFDNQKGFSAIVVGRDSQKIEPAFWQNAPVDLPTDDWPFLYLKYREIPSFYLQAMLFFTFLLSVLATYFLYDNRHEKSAGRAVALKLAFFAMGAAFLLLETKSIVQFSLLFGTTWLNSSLVFLAILLTVLVANWLATCMSADWVLPVFVSLALACLLPFVFTLQDFLQFESDFVRYVVASFVTFMPIFFANLLFSLQFKSQKFAENLFGWNILGAAFGGILEYSSMKTGYAFLLIIVLLLYVTAFICFRISTKNTGATAV